MKQKSILIYLSIIVSLCLALSFGFSCKAGTAVNVQKPGENSDNQDVASEDSNAGSTDSSEEQPIILEESQDSTTEEWGYEDFIKYFIDPLNLNTEVDLEDGFEVSFVNIGESDPEDNYNIAGMYPAIKGPSQSNADRFDSEVKAFVEKLSSDFIKEVKKANEELDQPEGMHFTNELNISGSPQMLNSKISSVLFLNYYFTGGAHGMTLSNPLNYDMKALKMLELKDVFKNDSEYLQKLSDYCRVDLQKQLKETDVVSVDEMFEEGVAPVYENYSNFVLLKNDIVIIFGQYQIAPYAAGMFGVRVPYKELSAYLADGIF